MVHAENGDAIDVLVKEALAAGNTAPKYHSLTRPPETEGEATNRAIQLAHIAGCPVYIVHVSCEDAIEPIERAREKGWDVVGETCTQYLTVDFSKIDQPGFEGAKYVYTPPPRDRHHVEACWEAIVTDKLSVVSTDHAPFNFKGQKDMGGTDDFSKIPNGPPGIEERLKILHELRRRGRQIRSEPARAAVRDQPGEAVRPLSAQGDDRGRQRRRSRPLRPRQEADDLGRHPPFDVRLQPLRGHRGNGCCPRRVLVRGQLVVDDGELVAQPGTGQFIKRARVGEKLLPTAGG